MKEIIKDKIDNVIKIKSELEEISTKYFLLKKENEHLIGNISNDFCEKYFININEFCEKIHGCLENLQVEYIKNLISNLGKLRVGNDNDNYDYCKNFIIDRKFYSIDFTVYDMQLSIKFIKNNDKVGNLYYWYKNKRRDKHDISVYHSDLCTDSLLYNYKYDNFAECAKDFYENIDDILTEISNIYTKNIEEMLIKIEKDVDDKEVEIDKEIQDLKCINEGYEQYFIKVKKGE